MERKRFQRVPRRKGFEAEVGGNAVVLYHDPETCLPEMLQAIERAEKEILMEMYWFASDRTGRRFAKALGDKARAGVSVWLMYDAVGSWETDVELFQLLREAGCVVHEYNPVAPWRQRFNLGVVNHRNHRKSVVIDGDVGFAGGINIGNEWVDVDAGGEGWRDDLIRVKGPAVQNLRKVTVDLWKEVAPVAPPEDLEPTGRTGQAEGSAPVRVVAKQRRFEKFAVREVYLRRIRAAGRNIFITNSYFVPDRAVRHALAKAAARGVDVRVLMPGESDVPIVYFASRRLYGSLMKHGIRLFEWHGSILHAKSASIDGRWCTVGSANLDWRSWRFNLELNLTVEDAAVADGMHARFLEDLASAVEVDPGQWRFRPLSHRVLEWACFLFRKLI